MNNDHARNQRGACTMDRESSINVAEKKRLRDSIEDQVQRFLANGGSITVVDAPGSHQNNYRGSTWHTQRDVPTVLD